MRVCRLFGLLLIALLMAPHAFAQPLPGAADRFFLTSDGVRLHYFEAGPPKAHTIIFIPGWTMPAWIWAEQITAFSHSASRGPLTSPSPPPGGGEGARDVGDGAYHVIAFDPRGQGASAIALSGYEPVRRGQDIADLIAHLGGTPVVLVGWSLGVLDTLAYVHTHGDRAIAGLVLVDNSVGEEPAPRPISRRRASRPVPRPVFMENFVRTMFRTPQSVAWLDRLTEAALRTPDWAARDLLAYPVPRTYWREAIYSTDKPVLYVVRPGLSGQAGNLERNRPDTESVVFTNAGHALFIDQAARFDALMGSFIRQRVWH